MARLESQATAGYFPTPGHLVPAIARLLEIDRGLLALDPCAGDGAAVVQLASELLGVEPARAAAFCTGIEMEAHRAEALARRLGRERAHRGDALTFADTFQHFRRNQSDSFRIVQLNPARFAVTRHHCRDVNHQFIFFSGCQFHSLTHFRSTVSGRCR